MGLGGSVTQRIDIIDSYDPRVTGRAAAKGTIFRYIPSVGDAAILMKQDNGFSTNWVDVGISGGSDTASNLGAGQGVFAAKVVNDFQFKSLVAGTNITITATGTEITITNTGGGVPTGDPNTIAYFNAGGNLASNISAKFDGVLNSMAYGIELAGGTINAGVQGGLARGYADNAIIESTASGASASGHVESSGLIRSSGQGSEAHGSATTSGQIVSSGVGAFAFGYALDNGLITAIGSGFSGGICQLNGSITADNAAIANGYCENSSQIQATGLGSFAQGLSRAVSNIEASEWGAHASGCADPGNIRALERGAFARGFVSGGNILATQRGSTAFGCATINSNISASQQGSTASGFVEDSAQINATANGAMAVGYCSNPASQIYAQGSGSRSYGYAQNGSAIGSQGNGSLASGWANFAGSILASGNASTAFGYAVNGILDAGQLGSFVVGGADNGNHNANGQFAVTFGLNNENETYACLMIGRFAENPIATPNAWVSTEEVFVIGNGTGTGSRANAFQIAKDGRMVTTGAQKHKVRGVSADTTLSARTDRSLFVDTAAAAGNVNVTFPPGEQGLEFFVKDSGNNASVNNVIFVPDGADTVEASANITNSRGTRHFQFFGNTWYVMNLP